MSGSRPERLPVNVEVAGVPKSARRTHRRADRGPLNEAVSRSLGEHPCARAARRERDLDGNTDITHQGGDFGGQERNAEDIGEQIEDVALPHATEHGGSWI